MDNKRYLLLALALLYSVAGHAADQEDRQQKTDDTDYARAQSLANALSCPLPQGMRAFQPIGRIRADDMRTQTLARDYVELKRRETGQSWQAAAQYFNQDQYSAANWQTRMQDLRAMIDVNLRDFRASNYANTMPLVEYIQSLADQYRNACNQYIDANGDWVAKDRKLAKLRQEKTHPWRSVDRPLTCSMLAGPHCYAD